MNKIHWQPWDRNDGETRSYTCEGAAKEDPILVHVDEESVPNTWAVIVYHGDNDIIAHEAGLHATTASAAQTWARTVARTAVSAR